ncbi:MAG TPA: hypothetical protein VMR74_02215 [Gammaproteobacteria bacterium]|nr:hypothetical protein [Gammaproteobacteria bacterium]
MKTRYFLLVWLASAALALPATAQDEAPEPPAGEARPPADEAADAAGEAEDEREAEAEEAGEVEEREFIFSEEIPADQQVTFPVDI